MSHRSRYSAVVLTLFVVLATTTPVHADVREKRVCVVTGAFPDADAGEPDKECFSGHLCKVGVRGDWLDLTDRASVESGPSANISISTQGTGDARGAIGSMTTCVPQSSRSREGYVSLTLTNIRGSGTMQIKLSRPNAIGGRDDDTVSVNVKKGETFLAIDKQFRATFGEPEEITLRGGNLDLLQLKDPAPGDEILSRSETQARVRLTFTRENSRQSPSPLDKRLQFAGPEPALNQKYGWPVVSVSGGSQNASAPSPAASQVNIRPLRAGVLFKPRNITAGSGLQVNKVDDSFCTGFNPNDVREIALPPFKFSITNTSSIPVTQGFTIDIVAAGAVLHTETVQGLGARATEEISITTWRGRQGRVILKNSQPVPCPPPGPCFSTPGRVYGCFVDASMGPVTPDPSIVVKVDPSRSIPDEATGDNSLPVN